jgi:signal transduction histidine kinase
MLTNVMVYNELGMMDDRDLKDFLDYFIIQFMQRDPRIVHMAVIDTVGKVVASSDIQRYGELYNDQKSLAELKTLEVTASPGHFNGESVLNISVPLNISSKSWGGLCICISTADVDDAISKRRKEITLIAILFFVLSLFIVRVGAKILAKPVIQLAGIMDGIKNNVDLEQVEALHDISHLQERRDELGTLQNSFLWMVQRLRQADLENKKAMETLIQTEKMVSIGQLAAGVAHEINNPLGGIALCFDNLVNGKLDEDVRNEHVEVINESLEKISKIVAQLLHFSRMTVKDPRPGNINSLIRRILLLLNFRPSQQRISIHTELTDLPPVMMDENLMGQVLMNILTNALQAMGDKGLLTIRTEHKDGLGCIAIEDTGPGIAPDILNSIFEPFFTTKSVGDGTGLGLSISKSIIEQHGGTITAEDLPDGPGAKFIIIIPLTEA